MYISKDCHVFCFSADNQPALTVNPGDTVTLETMDCFADQILSPEDKLDAVDWNRINPATGPIFVRGAQKGDALKVTIEKIDIRPQAVMLTGKELGELGHKLEGMHVKILPVENEKVVFNQEIRLPVDPMIGVIGTAPEHESINCGTPGYHGGNMDTKIIREGAAVCLPVLVEGGLLALGDLHAVMADGKVCVTGAEVAGKVRIKVELLKDFNLTTPLVENDNVLAVIYSHISLDGAVSGAVEYLTRLIHEKTGKPEEEVIMLLSLVGEVKVSQVVDPLKTARLEVSKEVLDRYGFVL